jgi:hypothetical protein
MTELNQLQTPAWSHLNNLQVGAYAEYFVKMEMVRIGFQVYSSEVDDRGIDFVARYEKRPFLEIQVKSIRGYGYVFMRKDKFKLSKDLYLALVLFFEANAPDLFLIPSLIWERPDNVFVSRDYSDEGQVSKPEWGLNISKKNMDKLEPYRFQKTLAELAKLT